ncbi:MAG: DUF3299 domain-containing protein [Pseudomonadota bacterium]
MSSTVNSANAGAVEKPFKMIEWIDLIPPAELEILMNPPEYVSEIEDGSAEDQIASQMKSAIEAANDDLYQQALVSTNVNANMNGAKIKLPGFIVPLDFDDDLTVTQFFLVPYFGACLHMPPPPPNQIILVDTAQGVKVDDLQTPFWVSGELRTAISENDTATSAYSMKLLELELYDY